MAEIYGPASGAPTPFCNKVGVGRHLRWFPRQVGSVPVVSDSRRRPRLGPSAALGGPDLSEALEVPCHSIGGRRSDRRFLSVPRFESSRRYFTNSLPLLALRPRGASYSRWTL